MTLLVKIRIALICSHSRKANYIANFRKDLENDQIFSADFIAFSERRITAPNVVRSLDKKILNSPTSRCLNPYTLTLTVQFQEKRNDY
jgi:hypothetical protein